jgi:hypothetical protein
MSEKRKRRATVPPSRRNGPPQIFSTSDELHEDSSDSDTPLQLDEAHKRQRRAMLPSHHVESPPSHNPRRTDSMEIERGSENFKLMMRQGENFDLLYMTMEDIMRRMREANREPFPSSNLDESPKEKLDVQPDRAAATSDESPTPSLSLNPPRYLPSNKIDSSDVAVGPGIDLAVVETVEPVAD